MTVTLGINASACASLLAACLVARPHLSTAQAALAFGGGCLGAVAITLIYAAFAAGAISLIAPLIACGTSIVPTLVASAHGEAPDGIQAIGILCALCAMIVITRSPPAISSHVPLSRRALALAGLAALASGVTISLVQLAASGDSVEALGVSGLSRVASLASCTVLFALSRTRPSVPKGVLPILLLGGLIEAAGSVQLLIATTLGSAGVVAVVASLYAVVTVLLAQAFLRERLLMRQAVGIAIAVAGVGLLSLG
jgi:drug/metabolite transporter (DMT)-like permease